jgi:hypothetical protein
MLPCTSVGMLHHAVFQSAVNTFVARCQLCRLLHWPLQCAELGLSAPACVPACHTQEVLQHVCSLSYTGDVRMGLAEDGSKVARIVQGSWQGLKDLYTPLLEAQVGGETVAGHCAMRGCL